MPHDVDVGLAVVAVPAGAALRSQEFLLFAVAQGTFGKLTDAHVFVLYSGSLELFTAWRETLGHIGVATHLGTDHGRAAAYDVALLGFFLEFDERIRARVGTG